VLCSVLLNSAAAQSNQSCQTAAVAAKLGLRCGGSPLDAAEKRTNVSGLFRVSRDQGVGLPNLLGVWRKECDGARNAMAQGMRWRKGCDGAKNPNKFGTPIRHPHKLPKTHNVKTPCSVARLVMERTDHLMLVGKGALKLPIGFCVHDSRAAIPVLIARREHPQMRTAIVRPISASEDALLLNFS
jgi:hypothetical protein